MLTRNGANYWLAVLRGGGAAITFSSKLYDGTTVNNDSTQSASTNVADCCQWFQTSYVTNQSFKYPQIFMISNNSTIFYGSGNTQTYMANDSGTIIGDGDTPPTFEDYKLAGNIITGFTATSSLNRSISHDGKIVGTATFNITNTSDSAFTIKEIGFCRRNDNGGGRVLLFRDVLVSPVTIQPSETGVLTYSLKLG